MLEFSVDFQRIWRVIVILGVMMVAVLGTVISTLALAPEGATAHLIKPIQEHVSPPYDIPEANLQQEGIGHQTMQPVTACDTVINNPIANCSFETGDFTSWIISDTIAPFYPMTVAGAGIDPWGSFFLSEPTDGNFAALHGFDSEVTTTLVIAQDVLLPVEGLKLQFDYRAAWNLQDFCSGCLDRHFRVDIEPAGGGTALQTTTVLTATANTIISDTGDLIGAIDVSAFAGSSVRISFEWDIPEASTAPAFFQLDNVSIVSNAPPVATADFYTTTEDVVLVVPAPGVLANDVDGDGDVITAVLGTTPDYGALELHDNGSFVYTPTQNFFGMDSFAYYVTDGITNSNSVEVIIQVTAVNDVPIANDDNYSVTKDMPLVIEAPGVLENDFDKEGQTHLYSISSDDDLLREIDPGTGATLNNIKLTLAGGGVIENGQGLATHPQSGELYAILKIEGQTGRELVTIAPHSGVATRIGDTKDRFANITFDDEGTLYGVTGDGAEISETLFILDTTTAISTMVTPLGNGDDGEALGFNPDDGLLYHASGHDTPCPPGDLSECVVFETVARTAPYTITNIPISMTVLSDEEPQALLYWQGGFLWKQYHGTGPLYWTTTDGVATLIGEMDHQAKGLAFFENSLTAVLDSDPSQGTVTLNADGSFMYTPETGYCGADTFTYHANDGTDDSNIATVRIDVCGSYFIYMPYVTKD